MWTVTTSTGRNASVESLIEDYSQGAWRRFYVTSVPVPNRRNCWGINFVLRSKS